MKSLYKLRHHSRTLPPFSNREKFPAYTGIPVIASLRRAV
jgi:hypothetical protein